MRSATVFAGLLVTAASAPAFAATVITFNAGSGALPGGVSVIQDFESFTGGTPGASIGANVFVFDDTLRSQGTRPTFGSAGNFGAVRRGGSYTVNFARADVFSFVLGSLDVFNSLTLLYENGGSQRYVGGQIIHGLNSPARDPGIRGRDNGVVTFKVTEGPHLIGAVFASTGNAFEFDNIATAEMPEPATWAMLIGGFGLVGAASRRRRPHSLRA